MSGRTGWDVIAMHPWKSLLAIVVVAHYSGTVIKSLVLAVLMATGGEVSL